jgi:hypothetical protein
MLSSCQALELEQWRSRFHAGQALPGISEEEATTIVHSELGLGVGRQNLAQPMALRGKGRVIRLRELEGPHEIASRRSLFISKKTEKYSPRGGSPRTSRFGANFVLADHRSTIIGRARELMAAGTNAFSQCHEETRRVYYDAVFGI